MNQRTIKKAVEIIGIGLHKGKPIKLRLEPLEVDSGIIFYREDLALSIPLSTNSVIDTKMATVIGNSRGFISTVEHFLSTIYAYGIDNLRVIVDGNEIPIMDGSASPFCMLLDEVGIKEQNSPKKILKIKRAVEVKDGDKFAKLEPSKHAIFNFKIDFNHPAIGRENFRFKFGRKEFIEDISRARTFGFARDIQYLQSMNLALGASLANAIGLDNERVLNPEGLRYKDEFVRHKILDAMGDLRVMGFNILGKYSAFAGGHKINHELTKKLLANSSNYEIVTLKKSRNVVEFEKSFA